MSRNFTPEEISNAISQLDSGMPLEEVCQLVGVSREGIFRWRKKYGDLNANRSRLLVQLTYENRRLAHRVEVLSKDLAMLQDVLQKKV